MVFAWFWLWQITILAKFYAIKTGLCYTVLYIWCVALIETFFQAPNFEEIEEAYWFGPVCLSVTLAIGLHSVKILFFHCQLDLSMQSYCPFQSLCFILLHCKPMETCEQNISRIATTRVMIFGSQIVCKV